MLKTVLLGVAGLVLLWIVTGLAVVALAGPFKPSGKFVDIGGRKLRLVCQGPPSAKPVIWMEAGAWGLAADFAAIQQRLAERASAHAPTTGQAWAFPIQGRNHGTARPSPPTLRS
jgi:hypothetical protein